jgi:hypothetical protein
MDAIWEKVRAKGGSMRKDFVSFPSFPFGDMGVVGGEEMIPSRRLEFSLEKRANRMCVIVGLQTWLCQCEESVG